MKKRITVENYDIFKKKMDECGYYEIPSVFFEDEYKYQLSNAAKIAYAVLRSRIKTGLENGHISEDDEVIYIKGAIDHEFERIGNDVAEELGMSELDALNAMKQLIEFKFVKLST